MNRKETVIKCILVGMLIASIVSTTCYAGGKDKDPPKLFIHKRAIDVGNVYEGRNITHEYTVRNNGAGELHIINVRPG